jgi:hypothetical protein
MFSSAGLILEINKRCKLEVSTLKEKILRSLNEEN